MFEERKVASGHGTRFWVIFFTQLLVLPTLAYFALRSSARPPTWDARTTPAPIHVYAFGGHCTDWPALRDRTRLARPDLFLNVLTSCQDRDPKAGLPNLPPEHVAILLDPHAKNSGASGEFPVPGGRAFVTIVNPRKSNSHTLWHEIAGHIARGDTAISGGPLPDALVNTLLDIPIDVQTVSPIALAAVVLSVAGIILGLRLLLRVWVKRRQRRKP